VDTESLQRTFPESWREFWGKRIFYWFTLALFFGSGWFFTTTQLSITSWPVLLTLLILIAVWAYAGGELSSFHCPRCHKRFFFPIIWPIFLQHCCAHCGLPKYPHDQI
jgi:hypothetical protein